MINFIEFPITVTDHLKGIRPNQYSRHISLLKTKIGILYRDRMAYHFYDMYNHTPFDNFLSSFNIISIDNKGAYCYYDEDQVLEDPVDSLGTHNIEEDLPVNGVEIKSLRRIDNINKIEHMNVDVQNGLNDYCTKTFWKDIK